MSVSTALRRVRLRWGVTNVYLASDFESYSKFQPKPQHEQSLKAMLDQLVAWGTAMKTLRP